MFRSFITFCTTSMNLQICWVSWKLHLAYESHTTKIQGHDPNAWFTSSGNWWHCSHTSSVSTLPRTKLVLVGIAFLQALHNRFLTLLRTLRLQIFFQTLELIFEVPPTVSCVGKSWERKLYPDLTVYVPDELWGQYRKSLGGCFLLIELPVVRRV